MKRALLILVLFLGCDSNPSQPQPPKPPPTDSTGLQEVRELYDAHLVARGSRPLNLHPNLCAAAQAHADWMAKNQRMSHTGAGGSNFSQRAREHGYTIRGGGENVAAGYPTVDAVMKGWMKSPGHRRNILNSQWKDAGFGVAKSKNGQLYWSATFATGNSPSALQSPFVEPGPLSE